MKKQQNNSTRAWALHVALSIALLSISAVLVASSFNAAPAARGLSALIKPVAAGDQDLVIAGPASAQSLSLADAPFTFGNTGALNNARLQHTATLLPNGKVLVAGGTYLVSGGGLGFLSSAELYDPELETCVVCHRRMFTVSLACDSLEYQRHLDHGDTLGPCQGAGLEENSPAAEDLNDWEYEKTR